MATVTAYMEKLLVASPLKKKKKRGRRRSSASQSSFSKENWWKGLKQKIRQEAKAKGEIDGGKQKYRSKD